MSDKLHDTKLPENGMVQPIEEFESSSQLIELPEPDMLDGRTLLDGELAIDTDDNKLVFSVDGTMASTPIEIVGLDKDLIPFVTDGYHTFDELYQHRVSLFIALIAAVKDSNNFYTWWSKEHHDPDFPMFDGFFIAGIYNRKTSESITYHIEEKYIKYFKAISIYERERAVEFDGHTPDDVVDRLLTWFTGIL